MPHSLLTVSEMGRNKLGALLDERRLLLSRITSCAKSKSIKECAQHESDAANSWEAGLLETWVAGGSANRAIQASGLNLFKTLVFDDRVGNYRMPFTKIVTERLALRQLVASDAEKIFEYRSRPDVSRYQSWGIESQAAIQSQIESLSVTDPGIPGPWYQIGIVLQSSGELIGDSGFHVLENEVRQAEFGISLVPEFQCQGYATEVLQALLNYLFVELGKHRVFGSVDPRNVRSIKLMQRVGMRKEAHFVRSLWFKGEWVDDMIFAILASDWRAMNGN